MSKELDRILELEWHKRNMTKDFEKIYGQEYQSLKSQIESKLAQAESTKYHIPQTDDGLPMWIFLEKTNEWFCKKCRVVKDTFEQIKNHEHAKPIGHGG